MGNVEILARVRPFTSLAQADLHEFADLWTRIDLQDGGTVPAVGISNAFLVGEGQVQVSQNQIVLSTFRVGDFFRHPPDNDVPRSISARAVGRVVLLHVNMDDWFAFFRRRPRAGIEIMSEALKMVSENFQ